MPRTTRASIIRSSPGKYETVELQLDDPRRGEVQVKLAASGLCHSDDHLQTGDLQVATYPFCGGHEGAGTITAVGPDTPGFEVGDHVVFSFVPSCGQCDACRRGDFNLCDTGANLLVGSRPDDVTDFRMTMDGAPVGQMCGISTFSEYTTADVASVIKIDKDIPLKSAALVGCGVPTGFGSAVKAAGVKPGDVVIVAGIGGIGINAVQGAAHAGATTVVAVDPLEFKREAAQEFGATHAFETIQQATEYVQSITNGQGADATIITIGVLEPQHPAEGLASIRKGGTCVVTGLGNMADMAPISMFDLTLMQKRLQGAIIGSMSPHADIPKLLKMYQAGKLKLDELITKEYTLDQVTEAYEDMHAGKNIRGVIVFD